MQQTSVLLVLGLCCELGICSGILPGLISARQPVAQCRRIVCGEKGDSCDGQACKYGLYCDGVVSATPKCAAYLPLGALCSPDTLECEHYRECKNGVCAEPGVGSYCSTAVDCPGPMVCVDNACAPGTYVALNGNCSTMTGPKCDPTAGHVCCSDVCIKAHTKQLGEACQHTEQCPILASCVSGRCALFDFLGWDAGDHCTFSLECKEGLVCSGAQGVCATPGPVPVGIACTSHQDCGVGVCECDPYRGHLACFKSEPFNAERVARWKKMVECAEQNRYNKTALDRCDDFALAREVLPWTVDCTDPEDEKVSRSDVDPSHRSSRGSSTGPLPPSPGPSTGPAVRAGVAGALQVALAAGLVLRVGQ